MRRDEFGSNSASQAELLRYLHLRRAGPMEAIPRPRRQELIRIPLLQHQLKPRSGRNRCEGTVLGDFAPACQLREQSNLPKSPRYHYQMGRRPGDGSIPEPRGVAVRIRAPSRLNAAEVTSPSCWKVASSFPEPHPRAARFCPHPPSGSALEGTRRLFYGKQIVNWSFTHSFKAFGYESSR
jgi:hypothetical protein